MTQKIRAAALFIVLMVAADTLKSAGENALQANFVAGLESRSLLTRDLNLLLAKLAIISIVYFSAGAITAWHTVSRLPGLVLAFLLGLFTITIHFIIGPFIPHYFALHSPAWFTPF
jgi:CBS domain containing-hemolysin-like protein